MRSQTKRSGRDTHKSLSFFFAMKIGVQIDSCVCAVQAYAFIRRARALVLLCMVYTDTGMAQYTRTHTRTYNNTYGKKPFYFTAHQRRIPALP